VRGKGREADVEPPTAPLLPAAGDQRISESKCAGLQIMLGKRTVVDIQIPALLCVEARPVRIP
jgi:hypothetical protein